MHRQYAHVINRLRSLIAPRGRHRAGALSHFSRPARAARPTVVATAPRRPGPYATDTPIDGRATAMIRPYLLTREQRHERRHRRQLRTLWVTAYGMRDMEVAR
ncbi:hypothetical protein [Streptomyces lydicus]|uniref:hypothetical protein n=1 Tax=Streptomyces lydicus TaxID=47763 RepID=UPI0010110118|nr:hypothetical protein [Streptomyces lydicus]MCZ1009491.1 hypothetical protein [Streptomyces lydicus]